MAVPLGLPDKTIGVLIVERDKTQPRFWLLDFNRIEIIASQAGIALANADLSMTLNKKLDALKLVSTFSEQISGHIGHRRPGARAFRKGMRALQLIYCGFSDAP